MTGWPIPGVSMRVVAASGADVRPDGEQIGEIVVRGNTVMQGYYRDPDGTAAAIHDGWLHTGDMATIDDAGYVVIKDRSKDLIIRGGENISSVDVENALAGHPAVLECAVVAAPDERFGEAPVAIVVLKPGATATANELKAWCKDHLARFKVPRDVHFRESLPKGGTGKILKAELRSPSGRAWTSACTDARRGKSNVPIRRSLAGCSCPPQATRWRTRRCPAGSECAQARTAGVRGVRWTPAG